MEIDVPFIQKLNAIGDAARERGDFDTINAVLRVIVSYIDYKKENGPNMDFTTFNSHLNALVSQFLEDSGDPSMCAGALRGVADEVFEEEDDGSRSPSSEDIGE